LNVKIVGNGGYGHGLLEDGRVALVSPIASGKEGREWAAIDSRKAGRLTMSKEPLFFNDPPLTVLGHFSGFFVVAAKM